MIKRQWTKLLAEHEVAKLRERSEVQPIKQRALKPKKKKKKLKCTLN